MLNRKFYSVFNEMFPVLLLAVCLTFLVSRNSDRNSPRYSADAALNTNTVATATDYKFVFFPVPEINTRLSGIRTLISEPVPSDLMTITFINKLRQTFIRIPITIHYYHIYPRDKDDPYDALS